MIVSFIITVRLALPAVLVAVAVVALVGGSMTVVIMVLGCLIWDRFAVVMRATTQQIRSMDYVQAAQGSRVLGALAAGPGNHAQSAQLHCYCGHP